MINLKKAVFTFFVGLGMTVAATASWAQPDFCTCYDMKLECLAGSAGACTNFNRLGCTRYNYSNADAICY